MGSLAILNYGVNLQGIGIVELREVVRTWYTNALSKTKTLDVEGMVVESNFMDTHIHGVLGYDTTDGRRGSILNMSRTLARYGVTAFAPTTVAASHEMLLEVAKEVRSDGKNPCTTPGRTLYKPG